MARDFYPFVEGEGADGLRVTKPARIAVYDDTSAAPRVVVIEPTDVRGYLEEITAAVSRLSREQGGSIPFMVIREIVENFVHAYFEAPTITILDGGDTIRFSDQGPGIQEKSRALEYGTTSATEEMRHYIRGVGSGLPYAQQYMVDHGGSLEIEDNISGGTVVTISMHPAEDARAVTGAQEEPAEKDLAPQAPPAWGWPQAAVSPWQQTVAYNPQPQPFIPSYQQPYAQPAYPYQQAGAVPAQGSPAWGAPPAPTQPPAPEPPVRLDERGAQALGLLVERGEAGPTDLVRAFGSSAATWSRTLSTLSAQGIALKRGQKYRLTEFGRSLCGA